MNDENGGGRMEGESGVHVLGGGQGHVRWSKEREKIGRGMKKRQQQASMNMKIINNNNNGSFILFHAPGIP